MKSHAVMRMKVNSNKGICPDFSTNILDGCTDDHDELPLVYPAMNLPPFQPQELPCSISVLRVVSAVGVNGLLIFLVKGTKINPRLRGKNLVTKYGLPEGTCVIPNKSNISHRHFSNTGGYHFHHLCD